MVVNMITLFAIGLKDNQHWFHPDTISDNTREAISKFLLKEPKYLNGGWDAAYQQGYRIITVSCEYKDMWRADV